MRKDKPRKCKNPSCEKIFKPTYSTTQPVCSPKCALEYNRFMEKKKADKEWRKEKKALKASLETKPDLEKKLQKEINTTIRLIDKGHNCISSNRPLGVDIGKYHAGHFYAVGGNPQIRFHLFNIFGQSIEQNKNKGGNPLGFMEGLKDTFGNDLMEYCMELKGLPSLKLSKEELREKTATARGIVKWLKLQDREFSTSERIGLRLRFQEELGIYEPIPTNHLFFAEFFLQNIS